MGGALRLFKGCYCSPATHAVWALPLAMAVVPIARCRKSAGYAVQVPGYPLCNFLLCSVLYVFAAFRLFNLTNTLKNAFVPHNDNPTLLRNTILMALSAAAMLLVGILLHAMLYIGHDAASENPLHRNIASWQSSHNE